MKALSDIDHITLGELVAALEARFPAVKVEKATDLTDDGRLSMAFRAGAHSVVAELKVIQTMKEKGLR